MLRLLLRGSEIFGCKRNFCSQGGRRCRVKVAAELPQMCPGMGEGHSRGQIVRALLLRSKLQFGFNQPGGNRTAGESSGNLLLHQGSGRAQNTAIERRCRSRASGSQIKIGQGHRDFRSAGVQPAQDIFGFFELRLTGKKLGEAKFSLARILYPYRLPVIILSAGGISQNFFQPGKSQPRSRILRLQAGNLVQHFSSRIRLVFARIQLCKSQGGVDLSRIEFKHAY